MKIRRSFLILLSAHIPVEARIFSSEADVRNAARNARLANRIIDKMGRNGKAPEQDCRPLQKVRIICFAWNKQSGLGEQSYRRSCEISPQISLIFSFRVPVLLVRRSGTCLKLNVQRLYSFQQHEDLIWWDFLRKCLVPLMELRG